MLKKTESEMVPLDQATKKVKELSLEREDKAEGEEKDEDLKEVDSEEVAREEVPQTGEVLRSAVLQTRLKASASRTQR